jgi:hypothetical protein
MNVLVINHRVALFLKLRVEFDGNSIEIPNYLIIALSNVGYLLTLPPIII